MIRLNPNVVRLHTRMLNDRGRTGRFIAAIRQTVRPGDVVVDLGTGTGILAMAAARAGARRVYAIEEAPVGAVARRLFAANGLAGRVELVPGHSTRVRLPERADVLVTETFGHGPLSEDVLVALADARRRLLKPGARIVPSSLHVFGVPVSIPAQVRDRCLFTPAVRERWAEWYGVDFGALARVNRGMAVPQWFDPAQVATWPALAPPATLAEVDLATVRGSRVRGAADVLVRRDGALDGVAIYFELRLSPSVTLSTDPRRVEPDNHWRSPAYLLVEPARVRRGDVVRITYRYTPGDRDERIGVRLNP
ncbi:MAG TPA: 50S ribosomal protein L11 methyltransferase [Longimicrobium sp.]